MLLIASFLRKSKTPENHLKASIAYSSTQQWILSGGFLGVFDLRNENLAININYRGGPAFWGIRYLAFSVVDFIILTHLRLYQADQSEALLSEQAEELKLSD